MRQLAIPKKQLSNDPKKHKSIYRSACKAAKRQVSDILNAWWQSKAKEIQAQVDNRQPQHQYAGFRELRTTLNAGRRPIPKLRDSTGQFLHTKAARVDRWQTYFNDLLNVPTTASLDHVAVLNRRPPQDDLANAPTFIETIAAVKRMKKNKAPGPDGLNAELLHLLTLPNLRVFHDHVLRVWTRVMPMPVEWKAGYIVPLPKKGDLTDCGNWRGITLLSVPGKIFARIIAARLYSYAESSQLLPEWQCGFRNGRSTIDMVFALRMILETALHKRLPMYLLFIDLVKAYDSVARAGLWKVLKSKGVPDDLLDLIKLYYSEKLACVSTEGILSSDFELHTGLGQGCCLAPLLFSIYFGAVMESWAMAYPNRLTWYTRVDGILRRQANLDKYATHTPWTFQELGFADDLALAADTLSKLQTIYTKLSSHMQKWGMTISTAKTEAMVTLIQHTGYLTEDVEGQLLVKFTDAFKYLGCHVDWQLTCEADITHRLDQARKAFWKLANTVWYVSPLSLRTKIQVYRSCVLSVLLYGSETWTVNFAMRKRLNAFHFMCLRVISGITRWMQQTHHIPNSRLISFLGVPQIEDLIQQNRMRWLGHIARMDNDRMPKQALFSFLPEGIGTARAVGRQRGKFLRDAFANGIQQMNVPLTGWLQFAQQNAGEDWKRKTRELAVWYSPLPPKGHIAPPDRSHELAAILRAPIPKVRKGWRGELEAAHALFESEVSRETSFLRLELQLPQPIWDEIAIKAETLMGPDWLRLDAEEVAATLLEQHSEWEQMLVDLSDANLFQMSVITAQAILLKREVLAVHPMERSPLPPVPKKTRLNAKSERPPAYFHPDPATEPAAESSTRTVEKYWHRGPIQGAQEGDYECPFEGCGRKFPNKAGLSKHLLFTHREGTYRDRTWDCPFCPPTFELESGLTKHLPLHEPDAVSFTCCECYAVFPGRDSVRMHINHAHSAYQLSFPLSCPHCVPPESFVSKSPHQYILHRLRKHVYR